MAALSLGPSTASVASASRNTVSFPGQESTCSRHNVFLPVAARGSWSCERLSLAPFRQHSRQSSMKARSGFLGRTLKPYAKKQKDSLPRKRSTVCISAPEPPPGATYAPSAPPYDPEEDPVEIQKRLQVSKRLERTANYFARLGVLGFWGQLCCTVVSAVILAFSIVVTGKATAPVTFYLTTGGIVAAFLSVFWSFGYTRLSERLRETISNPTKAPPRSQVVRNLTNGLIINLIGMGATLLGMQATVGTLVAKALTSSAQPFVQGVSPGYSPVLALDVFLVQASSNTVLSHFLGLILTLELLRAVTQSQPPPESVIPKAA